MITDGRWKLVLGMHGGTPTVRPDTPTSRNRNNLAKDNPETVRNLKQALNQHTNASSEGGLL